MGKLRRFWLSCLIRHGQPYTILVILFNQTWAILDDFLASLSNQEWATLDALVILFNQE